jgi:mRNA-degrading endonuclease YafQ of YafQ-DinJ toxin-antitoxin module
MQSFQYAYKQLPSHMQRKVNYKIQQLVENPAHPSLQVHRLRQAREKNVWICYISITKRLLYQYKDGTIYLWDVGEHAVVERIHQRRFK